MGRVPQFDPLEDTGSPPAAVDRIDGTVRPDEIEEGDLVFTSRPGLLQDLCNRAGEPWRHVGLATVHDDELAITEVSRNRFDIRPMGRVIDTNDEVAIARVEPRARHRAADAARWCRRHGRHEQLYAWHDVMLAGLIATARHYTVQAERDELQRAVEAAATVVGTRRPDDGVTTSYTCAAFIAEAFERSGHPIDVELRLPRAADDRPALTELIRGRTRLQLRASRPTSKEFGVVLYALLAGMVAARSSGGREPSDLNQYRWAMPGDLWRSPSVVERFIVTRDAARPSTPVPPAPLELAAPGRSYR